MKFRVWADEVEEKEGHVIKADGMPAALDEGARRYGYSDYADMAQSEKWGEDEGLNIKTI